MLVDGEGIKKVASAAWGVVHGVKVYVFELGPYHRKQRGCALLRG
jgi:hypothetical protein